MLFRLCLGAVLLAALAFAAPVSVTLAGSLQSELGCPGDWMPACATTSLSYDASDDVWQGSFNVPAGSWEYKVAINGGWAENYGANATPGGANIQLNLAAPATVKFYYDDKSHWVTDNVNSRIVVAPGNFQSELGCPGDWQPDCLRSWLQDVDGDGIYTILLSVLPLGSYEGKAAINEAWNENYGIGGTLGGNNIPFTVSPSTTGVLFRFVGNTNTLTIDPQGAEVPEPASAVLAAAGLLTLFLIRRR